MFDICPAPKGKAIVMTSIDPEIEQAGLRNHVELTFRKRNPMKKEMLVPYLETTSSNSPVLAAIVETPLNC